MKKLILIPVIAATLLLSGCTNSSNAKSVLDDMGFKNIKITGWRPFSCADDDSTRTGFEAININGKKVTGVVCAGYIFKNSTVRFD